MIIRKSYKTNINNISKSVDVVIMKDKTLNDSVLGINTVTFTGYGDGVHSLNSLNGTN